MAMRYLSGALSRNVAARHRFGPERFIDIDYDELVAEPITSAQRVYRALGLELAPAVEAPMRNWLRDQVRSRTGARHSYSLDEFGLDPDQVDALFESYSGFNPNY
jgi:hypothetical protein